MRWRYFAWWRKTYEYSVSTFVRKGEYYRHSTVLMARTVRTEKYRVYGDSWTHTPGWCQLKLLRASSSSTSQIHIDVWYPAFKVLQMTDFRVLRFCNHLWLMISNVNWSLERQKYGTYLNWIIGNKTNNNDWCEVSTLKAFIGYH